MGIASILLIICILFFTFSGYRKGLLKSLSQLFGLIAGYFCAFTYGSEAAQWIELNSPLKGMLAFSAGALGVFIVTSLAVKIGFGLLATLLPKSEILLKGSAIGGSLLGALWGAAIGFILVWVLSIARPYVPVLNDTSASTLLQVDIIENNATKIITHIFETIVKTVTNPELTNISTAIAASPVETGLKVKKVWEKGELKDFLSNPDNQKILNDGDFATLEKLPEFQEIAKDEDLQTLLEDISAIPPDLAETERTQAIAENMNNVWQRATSMKNNPRVQEILSDPEFIEQINNGNPLLLLNDSRFQELSEMLLSDE